MLVFSLRHPRLDTGQKTYALRPQKSSFIFYQSIGLTVEGLATVEEYQGQNVSC
jgi:hypothetical protein